MTSERPAGRCTGRDAGRSVPGSLASVRSWHVDMALVATPEALRIPRPLDRHGLQRLVALSRSSLSKDDVQFLTWPPDQLRGNGFESSKTMRVCKESPGGGHDVREPAERSPAPAPAPHTARPAGARPRACSSTARAGVRPHHDASQHAPRSSDRSVTTTSHRSRVNCLRRTPLPHAGPEPQPRHPGRRQRASYSGGNGDSPGRGPRKQQHRGVLAQAPCPWGPRGASTRTLDTDQRDAWSPRFKAADSHR